MKILIASTIVPFIEGGGTFIVDWLDRKLKEYGYETDVLKIPFSSNYRTMLEQMLALRLLDVTNRADRLITIRTPSYLLRHPNKVLWFIHHHRGAYDLWGTKYQDIPNTPEGLAMREYIMRADELAFSEAKKIYTNSKIISKRLKEFNNIESTVLYPPVLDPERFYCHSYSDFIFYPSRLTDHKRQFLAVEAMKYTKTNVKLIIAGKSESEGYLNKMEYFIEKNNLKHKVQIINKWISESEKIELLAKSLATIYIPFDEDSYGYPSLEAHHCEKAVITCTDSGGTLELIEDGYNGFVVEPEPVKIAEMFDKVYSNKNIAENMGKNGLEKLNDLGINWDNVVRGVTG